MKNKATKKKKLSRDGVFRGSFSCYIKEQWGHTQTNKQRDKMNGGIYKTLTWNPLPSSFLTSLTPQMSMRRIRPQKFLSSLPTPFILPEPEVTPTSRETSCSVKKNPELLWPRFCINTGQKVWLINWPTLVARSAIPLPASCRLPEDQTPSSFSSREQWRKRSAFSS